MFFGGFESSKEQYEVKKTSERFSGGLYFTTREWLLDDHDEIEQSYHTAVD